MGLHVHTPIEVDMVVAAGMIIGELRQNENTNIPNQIGDWDIRLAQGKADVKSVVVAVPTNKRTRDIYNAGRLKWLEQLGFDHERAKLYRRASSQVMYKWEEDVAKFVCEHYAMDTDEWYDITRASQPQSRAIELGYEHTLTRPRLSSAMNILMCMWDLED